jgi:hypothetical protein
MNAIVGCEESQRVALAFRALGFDAYSCDLQECSGGHPEYHLQMDVFEAIKLKKWDVGIFFPDCTYLTSSAAWAYKDGPYHMKLKPGTLTGAKRREARDKAVAFVKGLYNSNIEHVAIENPVGVLSTLWQKPTQYIHPHQFGDDASKKTCLWLRGLPELVGTEDVEPRYVKGLPRWGNQLDCGRNKHSPSPDRAKIRSKTFPGIAKAMANQWGNYLMNKHDTKS